MRFRIDAGDPCVSAAACVGDFDGDGFEDLLAREWDGDADEGWAWIIPGFDVPWDDDTRW